MSERSEARRPSGAGAERPWRLGYQPALDGVRALAILAVIAVHTGERRLGSGFYGVDVFFVLSGFLITTLVVQEHVATGRVSLRRFWQRRAARLLPALLGLCGLVSLVAIADALHSLRPVLNPTSVSTAFSGIGLALGYLVAWVLALSHVKVGALTHTWALSIEAWFYLLWPPLLILFLRRPRWLTPLVVSMATLATLYRLVSEQFLSKQYLYFALDQRACGILIGCALGVVMLERRAWLLERARAMTLLGMAGAAGLIVAMARPAHMTVTRVLYERNGVVLVSLAAGAAILSLALLPASPLARALSVRPLLWIGQRSYGLFLYHYALILLISPWSPNGRMPLRNGLIAIALSFALAAVSYHWLEQPAIRRQRAREQRLGEARDVEAALAPAPAAAASA